MVFLQDSFKICSTSHSHMPFASFPFRNSSAFTIILLALFQTIMIGGRLINLSHRAPIGCLQTRLQFHGLVGGSIRGLRPGNLYSPTQRIGMEFWLKRRLLHIMRASSIVFQDGNMDEKLSCAQVELPNNGNSEMREKEVRRDRHGLALVPAPSDFKDDPLVRLKLPASAEVTHASDRTGRDG